MLIKGIGGLIIILSSGLIGMLLSNKYSMRPRIIRKLRFSLQMLETEIIYGSTPLPYALYNIGTKSEKPWKTFFIEVSDNILKRRYFSMEDAWNNALEKHLSNSFLNKLDMELIKNFGKIIGKSDTEDQKKYFKLIYAQLKHHEEMAEGEREKNERMYRSLGFLFGAALYIILV